jgi:hypothetical protein
VVNPGPVSLPRTPDDRARWVLLETTPDGYSIDYRSVPYDMAAAVSDLERQRHPSSRWLAAKMTGSN